MMPVSVDVNASRVRAVHGRTGEVPTSVAWEPGRYELPLTIAVRGNRVRVGPPIDIGYFEHPEQYYRHFLHRIGNDRPTCFWRPEPQSLTPEQAVKLVFAELKLRLPSRRDVLLALPPYLESEQLTAVLAAAQAAGLEILAAVSSPLALALSACAEQPWSGTIVVIDVDDYALWLTLVLEADGSARQMETFLYPRLSLVRWKQRLADALADCCILQSRRDPRDFPTSEFALWNQLDRVMEHCVHNRSVDVSFQTSHWFQQLVLQPEETESFCVALARPVLRDLQRLYEASWPAEPPTAVVLSHEASRLPGLAVGIEELLDRWYHLQEKQTEDEDDDTEEDFGAKLVETAEEGVAVPNVTILPPDATAAGAHWVAKAIAEGEVKRGELCTTAPLPLQQPLDAGPARIQFQGRDYYLGDRDFSIGRRFDCDLVLDRMRWPGVAPLHCRLTFDQRRYFLTDPANHGTWVNDKLVQGMVPLRPGDRIRLGPKGPELQYRGHPGTHGLITIA